MGRIRDVRKSGRRTVVITVSFTSRPPTQLGSAFSETLAYTLPYAGSGARITVIYERLSEFQDPVKISSVLAHVPLHEITDSELRVFRGAPLI